MKDVTKETEAVLQDKILRLQHLDHSDHVVGEIIGAARNFIGIHFSPWTKCLWWKLLLVKKRATVAIAAAVDYTVAIGKIPHRSQ
ncbi:MAG: hypothetical protein R2788_27350 [Saprospiraceae bacterium]